MTAKPDALEALNELRKKHVVEPEYVPGAGGLLAIIEAALTSTADEKPVTDDAVVCVVCDAPISQDHYGKGHKFQPPATKAAEGDCKCGHTEQNHMVLDGTACHIIECLCWKYEPTESATGSE